MLLGEQGKFKVGTKQKRRQGLSFLPPHRLERVFKNPRCSETRAIRQPH